MSSAINLLFSLPQKSSGETATNGTQLGAQNSVAPGANSLFTLLQGLSANSEVSLETLLADLDPEQRNALRDWLQSQQEGGNELPDGLAAIAAMLEDETMRRPSVQFDALQPALERSRDNSNVEATARPHERPLSAAIRQLAQQLGGAGDPHGGRNKTSVALDPSVLQRPQTESDQLLRRDHGLWPDQSAKDGTETLKLKSGLELKPMSDDLQQLFAGKSNKPESALQAIMNQLQSRGADHANARQHEPATSPLAALAASQSSSNAHTAQSSTMAQGSPMPMAHNAMAFGQQLGDQVRFMLGNRQTHAQISLNPPELGSLDIRLKMDGDNVQIHFAAANSHARDAIDQALPRLRELFPGQQLDVQVGQQDSGRGQLGSQSQQGDDDGGSLRGRDEADEHAGAEAGEDKLPLREISAGLIDHYA